MSEAEETRCATYLQPMWAASHKLALAPAPTLAAALFKIELIKREELWSDGTLEADMFTIVAADLARLRGEA